jgi:hypothetical protein
MRAAAFNKKTLAAGDFPMPATIFPPPQGKMRVRQRWQGPSMRRSSMDYRPRERQYPL